MDGTQLEPTVSFALVRLDGADTVVLHRLLGTTDIGGRVRAVLRQDRTGSIHDVEGFDPI